MSIFTKLVNSKRIGDLYILSRYMYRTGRPIINDSQYDYLENSLIKVDDTFKYLSPYVERTYDDDPVPYGLLKEFNILIDAEDELIDVDSKYKYAKYLQEEKSLSIDSVYEIVDALGYLKQRRYLKQNIMLSLKVDGLNNKILYVDKKFYVDISRGRAEGSKAIDYSLGAVKILPMEVNTTFENLKIFGESYVSKDYLEYLQNTYNTGKYKTPKGSAKSMLVLNHADEDYKHLYIKIFKAEGVGSNAREMFEMLEEWGMDVVPHLFIAWEEIPTDDSQLADWVVNKMAYFEQFAHIPSDGVVIDLDSFDVEDNMKGKYNTNQIALKFGYWKALKYSGIITKIHLEQQRVFCSVVVEIEPILSEDNSTLTRISGLNPDILINNGLNIGSQVNFERDSGTVTKLIRNK